MDKILQFYKKMRFGALIRVMAFSTTLMATIGYINDINSFYGGVSNYIDFKKERKALIKRAEILSNQLASLEKSQTDQECLDHYATLDYAIKRNTAILSVKDILPIVDQDLSNLEEAIAIKCPE